MLQALKTRLVTEPAIRNAVLALASLILLNIVDVIEASGGELIAVAAAVLGQAKITREAVTPTVKLDAARRVTD